MKRNIASKEVENSGVIYHTEITTEDNTMLSAVCELKIPKIAEKTQMLSYDIGIISISGGIISINLPEKCDIICIYNTFIELCEEIENDIKQEQNA